jgi:hypothetical protein
MHLGSCYTAEAGGTVHHGTPPHHGPRNRQTAVPRMGKIYCFPQPVSPKRIAPALVVRVYVFPITTVLSPASVAGKVRGVSPGLGSGCLHSGRGAVGAGKAQGEPTNPTVGHPAASGRQGCRIEDTAPNRTHAPQTARPKMPMPISYPVGRAAGARRSEGEMAAPSQRAVDHISSTTQLVRRACPSSPR